MSTHDARKNGHTLVITFAEDDCDPPIDTDPILAPPGASQALVNCMNNAYFDFLVCYGNATSCEEKRSCRYVYEQAVKACIELYGT